MREKPGPDVAVRAISPVREAPMQAQIDAISSSICRKTPPILGSSWAMVSMISELGVMGYPAKNRTPASSAPSAQALLPCTSRLLRSTFSRRIWLWCQSSMLNPPGGEGPLGVVRSIGLSDPKFFRYPRKNFLNTTSAHDLRNFIIGRRGVIHDDQNTSGRPSQLRQACNRINAQR